MEEMGRGLDLDGGRFRLSTSSTHPSLEGWIGSYLRYLGR